MPVDAAGVVVDAQPVQRLAGGGQLVGCPVHPGLAEHVAQRLGAAAEQRGVEELAVHVGVGAHAGGDVLRPVAGRVLGLEVDHQAHLAAAGGAQRLHAQAVGHHQVARGDGRLERTAVARGQRAVQKAAVGDHPRLVQRGPAGHTVAQGAGHHLGIVGKPARAVGVEPAAPVVQRGRPVPVVQGEQRRDAGGQQLVDQPVVEPEAGGVHPTCAGRQHPRPGHREAVGLQPQLAHQRHVVGHAVVVVAGHVAGVAMGDAAGRAHEAVPVADAGTVGQRRALDLVGRCGRAPQEAGRKHGVGAGGSGGWCGVLHGGGVAHGRAHVNVTAAC